MFYSTGDQMWHHRLQTKQAFSEETLLILAAVKAAAEGHVRWVIIADSALSDHAVYKNNLKQSSERCDVVLGGVIAEANTTSV